MAVRVSEQRATLYDLVGELATLEAAIDQLEEQGAAAEAVVDELYTHLIQTDGRLSEKLEGYAALIKNADAYAAMLKNEEANLAAKRKVAENRAQRLRTAVQQAMTTLGLTRQEAGRFEFRLQSNGGKLPVVFDPEVRPEARPSEYWRVEIKDDVDAIRAALEAGEELPGARLGDRGVHLRLA